MLSRRGALRAGAVFLPVAIAGCSSSCPDDGQPTPSRVLQPGDAGGRIPDPTVDWPEFRGNKWNTGVVEDTMPPEEPAAAWMTRVPGKTPVGPPALADGVVYVVDDGGTLRALDAHDGNERWSVAAGTGRSTGPPTVAAPGIVIAGESGAALVADREVVWQTGHETTAPAVVDEHLLLPTKDALLALDADDGSEVWRAGFDGPVSRPAVAAETVYATDGRLQALDLDDGSLAWTTSRGGVESHPVLAGDLLVGSHDGLIGYDPGDGGQRWRFERGSGRGFDAPVATMNSLYVVELVGEGPDSLYALDWAAGAPSPRWCTYLGEGHIDAASRAGPLVSMPADEGPATEWALQSLSRDRGQGGWALHATGRIGPPAVSAGSVFFTAGRTIVAIGERGDGA